MAEFPALTLWTDAYLSDTRHLSTVEHGAYLLLLMEAWRRPHCDLPDDDKILARLAGLSGDEWADIKDTVLAFWKRDGRSKTWSQKRLCLERDRARVRSRSQSDKATKRWEKTKKSDATAMPGEYPDDASTATATAIREEEEPIGSPSSTRPPENAQGELLPDDPPPPAQRPKRERKVVEETPLPKGFTPNLGPKRAAMVAVWPSGMLENQLERFRKHAIRNQRMAKDWDAAFGTWVENANKGMTAYAGRSEDVGGGSPGHSAQRGGDGFTRALDRAERAFGGSEGFGMAGGAATALD